MAPTMNQALTVLTGQLKTIYLFTGEAGEFYRKSNANNERISVSLELSSFLYYFTSSEQTRIFVEGSPIRAAPTLFFCRTCKPLCRCFCNNILSTYSWEWTHNVRLFPHPQIATFLHRSTVSLGLKHLHIFSKHMFSWRIYRRFLEIHFPGGLSFAKHKTPVRKLLLQVIKVIWLVFSRFAAHYTVCLKAFHLPRMGNLWPSRCGWIPISLRWYG